MGDETDERMKFIPSVLPDVEVWVFIGASKVEHGKTSKTDTSSYIEKFTDGVTVVNNGIRGFNTEAVLGKRKVRRKRVDMVGDALKGPYDGMLVDVGVSDVMRGWSSEKTMKNYMEMYLRAYVHGAGSDYGAVLDVLKELDSAVAKEKNVERKKVLVWIKETYNKVVKEHGTEERGRPMKRVVFLGISPWGTRKKWKWTEKKQEKTHYNNRLLGVVAEELNGIFEDGPEVQVAQVYDDLKSPEDGNELHVPYSADGLHLKAAGRKATAAAIVEQCFEERKNADLSGVLGRNKRKGPQRMRR